MSQEIDLEQGAEYELVFTGFSGDWEARDTDYVSTLLFANKKKEGETKAVQLSSS